MLYEEFFGPPETLVWRKEKTSRQANQRALCLHVHGFYSRRVDLSKARGRTERESHVREDADDRVCFPAAAQVKLNRRATDLWARRSTTCPRREVTPPRREHCPLPWPRRAVDTAASAQDHRPHGDVSGELSLDECFPGLDPWITPRRTLWGI